MPTKKLKIRSETSAFISSFVEPFQSLACGLPAGLPKQVHGRVSSPTTPLFDLLCEFKGKASQKRGKPAYFAWYVIFRCSNELSDYPTNLFTKDQLSTCFSGNPKKSLFYACYAPNICSNYVLREIKYKLFVEKLKRSVRYL